MITKTLDENTISLMPEDSDDLLTIRRILKIDDKIIGETTRVIKQDRNMHDQTKEKEFMYGLQSR